MKATRSICVLFCRLLRRILKLSLLGSCLSAAYLHAAPTSALSEIRVALEDSHPPYIFHDHEGKLQGILKDTWDLWEKKTGIKVRFVSTDKDIAQGLLYSDRVDVIDALIKTPERLRQLEFSHPYAQVDASLFFHKSILGVNDLKSLHGFVLGVTKGDGNIEWLRSHSTGNLVEYRNYETLVQAASKGDVRLFFSDNPAAIYWLNKYQLEKDFRHTRPLHHGALHWATLKKNHALHEEVEQGFKLISAQERQEIQSRWLGLPVPSWKDRTDLTSIIGVLILTIIASVALFIRNRMLRQKIDHHSEALSSAQQSIQAIEQRVNYLAFYDTLTGLPNRQLAQDRLEQAVTLAERDKGLVALLFLDLDNFKAINDTLAHAVGDQLLQQVGSRLTEALRDTDTVCCLGGDAFLVVLPRLRNAEGIVRALGKITDQLREPFEIQGNEVTTSASIGISIYPQDGKDFETLLKNSEIAMYKAKEAGRNAYRFFDENMHVGMHSQLSMANGLRHAIERDEFVLHFQPQIDLSTGSVIGAEALLRWHQPENGIVSPAEFIPVAEKSGLIVPIGEWVLHEACRQAVVWHKSGWPKLVMAVNLSAVQFKRPDLAQSIIQVINSTGIDPTLLELELTESTLVDNPENVVSVVRHLKSLGIKLAIDDFGTGYSSLSYLKQFAVDKLKIDRSFVSDLASDPDDAAIVRAIIQMAQSLDLKTIAEGVENEEILERLRMLHCDGAQGFFFSRPVPAEAFSAYLEKASAEK